MTKFLEAHKYKVSYSNFEYKVCFVWTSFQRQLSKTCLSHFEICTNRFINLFGVDLQNLKCLCEGGWGATKTSKGADFSSNV